MEASYSKTMKAMMKGKPSLAFRIGTLLLAGLLVLGSIISLNADKDRVEKQKAELQLFDPFASKDAYSTLTPQFLSEEYAANYNDTVYYCLALDADYNAYIVAISADQMEQYRDLIDYTYDENITTPPAKVTLTGMPKEIDAELVDYTVEAYNTFYGGDMLDADSYQMILGEYYLDTTSSPAADSTGFIVLLFLGILVLVVYALRSMKYEPENKLRKTTLEQYQGQALWAVDQELNQPETLHLNTQKIHFTSSYIVTGAQGFEILRYDEMKQVYGLIMNNGNRRAIVAVTNEGVNHNIAFAGMGNEQDMVIGQIVERIKASRPEIPYGISEGDFYQIETSNSEFDFDTEGNGKTGKSNILLGILGAIVGAVLGGVLWIVIGKVGFIAGLAGYLMMLFSIKGYQKLSGYLDKKGQIISLIIAFAMIFGANYLLYALNYCEGFYESYSVQNIIRSMKELPEFLALDEVKWSFYKDLGVGYLLSIWAGYRLIAMVLFHKNEKTM